MVGDKLILQREPENRFDENAILVLDDKKRKLGYIPEKDNIVFARLMDAGKYLIVKIDRMEEKGSFRQINISIYLVDF
ncbi:MAG: HIRAN domain-containing protein [Lachnospiraceae bacterium]|nr:HIRAN domain-containing protein [Lachnospiraceae bacterium]